MTRQPTAPTSPTWSVEAFAAFWSNPDPALVPGILTEDVVGYWPGSTDPVRGRAEYTRRIADVLELVPGLRLEVAEHAASEDFVFIRWIMHGTNIDASPPLTGVDRVRVRDGLVAENVIVFDSARFEAVVGRRLSWA